MTVYILGVKLNNVSVKKETYLKLFLPIINLSKYIFKFWID